MRSSVRSRLAPPWSVIGGSALATPQGSVIRECRAGRERPRVLSADYQEFAGFGGVALRDPAGTRRFGMALGPAGFFDIVKSECVRSSGPGSSRADGWDWGVVGREVSGSLTAPWVRTCVKQMVFWPGGGFDPRGSVMTGRGFGFRDRSGGQPPDIGPLCLTLVWSSIMRVIKCHKGIWWMPWR